MWVAGFWTPTGSQKIQYLPVPPAYEDMEPPGLPPSEDVVWVPPCAYWSVDHYVRRAGYWVRQSEGWIWIPSHYVWTPRGYVFVAGHWDYSLTRRGVLFAPVYFPHHVHVRPGFTYAPRIVIDLGVLRVSLFDCPRYSHYYFGDYYDDVHRSRGIYPRFESVRSHTWYDPLFVHDVWRNRRTDPEWVEHQRQDYDRRRADHDLRPPRTYREMEARVTRAPEARRGDFEVARPFSSYTASRSQNVTFQRMGRGEQKAIETQANNTQRFREQRNRWESTTVAQKTPPAAAEHKSPAPPAPTTTPRVESRPPVAEGRRGVTSVPTETGRSARPVPFERGGPRTAPDQDRTSAAAPPAAAPRSVPVTKPETVNIPKPPITAKPATGPNKREAAPPTKPAEERRNARDNKDRDDTKKK
jgi:hypothetical protein